MSIRVYFENSTSSSYRMELTMQQIVDSSLKCWKATRINGASASMACDSPDVCLELVKAFNAVSKVKRSTDPTPTCKWKNEDGFTYWWPDCGNELVLVEGTPSDNGMIYCPYCGKKIKE